MGADMELVRLFNTELSSIYEGKPPISKAKMASITRYAVKALKYYKHVVHSVEKFIQKCHNEYKVPALYVLDSIIRQSRHQFGPEKDLFGPRFQKNIKVLFQYIYQCPSEDKPKVVRVLNLWQKNGIYPPETISPLVDMASASQKSLQAAISKHKKQKVAAREQEDDVDFVSGFEIEERSVSSSSNKKRKGISMSQDDEIKVLKAQLEQQKKEQELLQQQLQMQMMQTKQQSIQFQLQQQEKLRTKMQEQLKPLEETQANPIDQPNFNIMAQIQDLQKQLEKDKLELASLADKKDQEQPQQHQQPNKPNSQPNPIENQSQFLENIQQLIQNSKGLGPPSKDPRGSFNNGREEYQDDRDRRNSNSRSPNNQHTSSVGYRQSFNDGINEQPPTKKPLLNWEDERASNTNNNNTNTRNDEDDAMQIDNDDYEPSFQQQQQPSSTQDPRKQGKPEEMSEEMQQLQREKEKKMRDKRLLPAPKQRCITVASVTLWVGRLPRNFNSESLFNHFNEYAAVKNIDYIESRGCAFVIMASRFDADSALRYMKHKRIENHEIRLSWGKTKALFEFSKYWDDKTGCTFIPWGTVTEQLLEPLLETCIVDEESLPPGMTLPSGIEVQEDVTNTPSHDEIQPSPITQQQQQPPAFIPGFPPPGMFAPPPGGMMPPGMPPPQAGFQGGRLSFPPPHGMVPHNIMQLNLQQRPLLQGIGLQQQQQQQQSLPGQQGFSGLQRPPLQGLQGLQRPPLQGLQGIQQQFGGNRPPLQLNNFREQLSRPGGGQPHFPGGQPQFPGQRPQRPQTGFMPAFSGGPPPSSSNFPERPPLSPNAGGIGRPPPAQGFGERPPLNPLSELLLQRPGLQGLINRNRLQQQQNNENRFTNQHPTPQQQDTLPRVSPSSLSQPPTAPGGPPRPPWLQNRDNNNAQHSSGEPLLSNDNMAVGNRGNAPTIDPAHWEENEKWEENKNPANIPTAAFLLNLVNQHKEHAAAAVTSNTASSEVKSSAEEEQETLGASDRQRSPAREDRDNRDSRDRRRSRSRDRGRRDRSHRDDRDRSRDRSRRDRDRSSERDRSSRRDRSGDRRSGRDRERHDRRGGVRDDDRRRNSRERSSNYGRDRSRDRDRRDDRKSRDKSQEINKEESAVVDKSVNKDDKNGDNKSPNRDEIGVESDKDIKDIVPDDKGIPALAAEADDQTKSSNNTEGTVDLYDPLEAAMDSPTIEPVAKTDGAKKDEGSDPKDDNAEEDSEGRDPKDDNAEEDSEGRDPKDDNAEENNKGCDPKDDNADGRSPSPERSESPIFPLVNKKSGADKDSIFPDPNVNDDEDSNDVSSAAPKNEDVMSTAESALTEDREGKDPLQNEASMEISDGIVSSADKSVAADQEVVDGSDVTPQAPKEEEQQNDNHDAESVGERDSANKSKNVSVDSQADPLCVDDRSPSPSGSADETHDVNNDQASSDEGRVTAVD